VAPHGRIRLSHNPTPVRGYYRRAQSRGTSIRNILASSEAGTITARLAEVADQEVRTTWPFGKRT
jgi:hypothetical protein